MTSSSKSEKTYLIVCETEIVMGAELALIL